MTKRFTLLSILSLALLTACIQEQIVTKGKSLGEVTVESDAGQIPVLISADGIWKAASLSDWIDVDDAWHRGECAIMLSYGSNRSVEGLHRSSRTGKVTISSADGAECDTLYVSQKGIEL